MISYAVAGVLGAVVGTLLLDSNRWVVAIVAMAVGLGVGAFSDLLDKKR